MRRGLPDLMTSEQVREETGLPAATVRSLLRRVPHVSCGMRRVVVRRADVLRVLRDDPPGGAATRER
jgi:hypothetical protein